MGLWSKPTRGDLDRLQDAMETLDDRVSAVKGRQRTVDAKLGSLTQRCTRSENKIAEILHYLATLGGRSSAPVDPDDPELDDGTDDTPEVLDINDRRRMVGTNGQ